MGRVVEKELVWVAMAEEGDGRRGYGEGRGGEGRGSNS
jgi:hypothetical protein